MAMTFTQRVREAAEKHLHGLFMGLGRVPCRKSGAYKNGLSAFIAGTRFGFDLAVEMLRNEEARKFDLPPELWASWLEKQKGGGV